MKQKLPLKILYKITLWASIIGIIDFIVDFGYSQNELTQEWLSTFYFIVLGLGVVSTIARYIENFSITKIQVFIFDVLYLCFALWIYYLYFLSGNKETAPSIWIDLAVFITFIREFSVITFNYKRNYLNPAQLFIASFLLIILLGSFFLMLPNATHSGISFIDALFTSTSAVCVTGLIVVDTGTYFTTFGQAIIMLLIQIGGLGILTFVSYFSYFFKGGSSYESQLALSDITSSEKIGEVFSLIKRIIIITFTIELFAGILIYTGTNDMNFHSKSEQIFFSVFHSISAFCNAGFSTLSNNLYETGFKHNYNLQLVIIATFILGGLGFPIVSNLMYYLKYKLLKFFTFNKKKIEYKPWILTLNSRITLFTTFIISLVAFLAFLGLEYNNTLADHEGMGKIVTALFGATTPRTAGFNTIDTASMLLPTSIIIIFLMWIGASPISTGGGIKTTTFAIAVLNVISLSRGKTRIEIFRREISDNSIKRAFATIYLSLMVIGTSVILISFFDGDKGLLNITFECFSAFSTVGLSMGITSSLSNISKLILMVVMFIGRVSILSIFIAFFRKIKQKNYRYPTNEITIN